MLHNTLNPSPQQALPEILERRRCPVLRKPIQLHLSTPALPPLLLQWALGVYGFRFPFLLTSTHMLFSFCILAPVALREPIKSHKMILEKQWKGVVYIGSFLALNIALNNISLLDISLSLNQVIRCAGGACSPRCAVQRGSRQGGLQRSARVLSRAPLENNRRTAQARTALLGVGLIPGA